MPARPVGVAHFEAPSAVLPSQHVTGPVFWSTGELVWLGEVVPVEPCRDWLDVAPPGDVCAAGPVGSSPPSRVRATTTSTAMTTAATSPAPRSTPERREPAEPVVRS